MKPRRIRAGPLQGCRLVTSWRDYPAALLGYTELPLMRWLSSRVASGETWLDVGAHYGYTSVALSRLVGAEGRVFAFEPVLETAGHLSATRRINGLSHLTVVPLGLSSAADLTAIEAPLVRGMADHGRAAQAASTTILVVALDSVWGRLASQRRDVHGVKIDGQGMELETVTGMRHVLAASHPQLVIEFHAGVERERLLGTLETLGYRLPGLPVDPVAGEPPGVYMDDRSYSFV